MKYTNYKNISEYLLRLVLVTFGVIVIGNIAVWLLSQFTIGKWTSVMTALAGFLLLYFGQNIRPGEERFAETVLMLAGVILVITASIALAIPMFNFITDVYTPAGVFGAIGALWMSDGLYTLTRKKMRI